MPKKLTFEYVYNYFKEHGCELLAKEYINNRTKMPYKCSCGNDKCEISFSCFKRGYRCDKCRYKRSSKTQSHTYDYVYNYFKEHGCELLTKTYINNKTKLPYKCSCGNDKCKITFASFEQGHRCMKCSGKEKLTFEYVYDYFKEHGCELLAKEYENYDTKMPYKCSCGNDKCEISFHHFRQGERCMRCKGSEKYTYEYVYNYFKEHGCELLSKEYPNNHTLLKYKCNCKRISYINFNNFQKGQRCKKCASEKNSGENHWNYNPDLTDKEREIRRDYPEYREWRAKVYRKNYWTCQICFIKDKKICAHHLENYLDNKELRLIVSNGITLCEKHHKEFHKIYGNKNNTRKQFEDFFKNKNIKTS